MDYLFRLTQKLLLIFGHIARILVLDVKLNQNKSLNDVRQGPLLIVANHKSYIDSILIGTCLPFFSKLYPLRFMAKDEFFANPLGAFIFKIIGAYPAFNKQGMERSIKIPSELLSRGSTIVMFPEGQCIRKDELGRFKIGVGVIASMFPEINILPISLGGTHKIMQQLASFRRPKVAINIGEPFRLKEKSIDRKMIDPEISLKIINEEIIRLYGNNC